MLKMPMARDDSQGGLSVQPSKKNGKDDLWVKLTITVSLVPSLCTCLSADLSMTAAFSPAQVCPGGPAGQPVALEIKDCGECTFCLDKPRFGGKGTKRQKCINKKTPSQGPVQAWASLRITSKQHEALIEQYASQEVRTPMSRSVRPPPCRHRPPKPRGLTQYL